MLLSDAKLNFCLLKFRIFNFWFNLARKIVYNRLEFLSRSAWNLQFVGKKIGKSKLLNLLLNIWRQLRNIRASCLKLKIESNSKNTDSNTKNGLVEHTLEKNISPFSLRVNLKNCVLLQTRRNNKWKIYDVRHTNVETFSAFSIRVIHWLYSHWNWKSIQVGNWLPPLYEFLLWFLVYYIDVWITERPTWKIGFAVEVSTETILFSPTFTIVTFGWENTRNSTKVFWLQSK